MSEELLQRGLLEKGIPFGQYEFFNIGRTTISNLSKRNIITKKDYEESNRQPDALIIDRRNKKNIQTIAVIEFKNFGELSNQTQINAALEQCNDYCYSLKSRIGIVTDSQSFFWINPQAKQKDWDYQYKDKKNKRERGFSFIKDEKGNSFSEKFDIHNTSTIEIINKLVLVITESNSSLTKYSMINPSLLAKQVWQSVWLATGDDPKKCLMTFTELFIYKYLTDLKILTISDDGTPIDFNTVYNVGKSKCLKYYLTNVRPYIKKIFPESDTDCTTIINGLSLKKDQNQDNLFYNILESFQRYGELKNIDPQFKSRLFEDFLKGTTGKKQLAQFFTPRNVIKAIVDMANVKNLPEGAKVLDPCGGVGGFIIESVINRSINEKVDFKFEGKNIKSEIQYRSLVIIYLAQVHDK